MLIRQKTANAAKTSLFGAGVFSDARFDATSLRDYEISHKMDPSFLIYRNERLASCIWHSQLKRLSVFTLLLIFTLILGQLKPLHISKCLEK